MQLLEIIVIGIGLAMDVFAVSIGKGLAMKKLKWRNVIIIALFFGFFHAVFPILGYLLGSTVSIFVQKVDHWIAFILLAIIGINMVKNSNKKEIEEDNDKIYLKTLTLLAVATSIDALAVGITFAFFKVNILVAILILGSITFVLSLFGFLIGNKFGDKFKNKSEIAGGIILIIIGLKIFLEHIITLK